MQECYSQLRKESAIEDFILRQFGEEPCTDKEAQNGAIEERAYHVDQLDEVFRQAGAQCHPKCRQAPESREDAGKPQGGLLGPAEDPTKVNHRRGRQGIQFRTGAGHGARKNDG